MLLLGAAFYLAYWWEGEEEPGALLALRYSVRISAVLFAITLLADSLAQTRRRIAQSWFASSYPYWIISFAMAQIAVVIALIWLDIMSWDKPLQQSTSLLTVAGVILFFLVFLLCSFAFVKILRPWWIPPRGLRILGWTAYTLIATAVAAMLLRWSPLR